MSPGALLYHAKVKFKHGLRVAYYRDQVRPRILHTPPINHTNDTHCEIHVLTSTSDWLNLLWALKSFYFFSGRRYGLCIHDDGTVTDDIRDTLSHHFPQARLIKRSVADAQACEQLAAHPRCLDFRLNNHLAPKIFDFPRELQGSRMLLLDSDVLFFSEPTELLRRIEDPSYKLNTVNRDVKEASPVDPQIVKARTGIDAVECYNSGLGLIWGESLNIDWIEEFLDLPNILSHFWRTEQTLYMLCSARWGCELLPAAYNVHLGNGEGQSPSRHYVGAVRHLMYNEGIARLVKQGFLNAKPQQGGSS